MNNIMFFRNDDVRDTLDESLIRLTDIFIENRIPITHAVEPANISKEVVEWLIELKCKNPNLIEIMQHGYDHKIKNKYKKGEFGGQRTYEEQYNDIQAGKELMDSYFGDLWFQAFNFPYAPYNLAAIKAVNDCGFKVLNSHFNYGLSRRIFYFIGHLLKKGILFDHHISWNLDYYPNTKLFEIDMNISFINKYINEQNDAEFNSFEQLKKLTKSYKRFKTIGVLFHHRYHTDSNKFLLVEDYLKWCKKQNFEFLNIHSIFNKFKK